jgi:hypothetical protein
LPGEPGGGDSGGEPEGLPPMNETETPPEPVLSTEAHGEHADDYVRPSQKGVKKASDYRFGEDPLGNKENNAKPRPGRELVHKYKNDSPLTLEHMKGSKLIKDLQMYLDKTKVEKKALLQESKDAGHKSILDESNIIGE